MHSTAPRGNSSGQELVAHNWEVHCGLSFAQQLAPTRRWSCANTDVMAKGVPAAAMVTAFCMSLTTASRSSPLRVSITHSLGSACRGSSPCCPTVPACTPVIAALGASCGLDYGAQRWQCSRHRGFQNPELRACMLLQPAPLLQQYPAAAVPV